MFGLGMQELLVILVIVIILFGGSRLPEIGKGIGKAIGNFKKGMSEPDEIDVTPKKDIPKKEEKEKEKEGE
jgi:sec-independent protein translocase protein TatA